MRHLGLSMLVFGLAVLVSGCAVPQPQNTPVKQWKEVSPVTGRGFWIYVPSTYRDDVPAKVIITCHGTPPFDVSEMHIREWKMIGENNGCIVVAPDMSGTDGILGDGPLAGMLENERIIMNVISELGYRYNIDLANIMITGFSGGGFPTYWVGLRHPEIISCVVARNCNFSESNLDGWYPPEAQLTPIMIYYGTNDPGTIIGQSRHAIEYLTKHGFNVTPKVLPGVGHERHPDVAMAFFRQNWRKPRPSLPTR
jgi:poly(3-hydroxybutyrate) depolymerase